MTSLREMVAAQPLTQPELPLVHTTRCRFLEAFVLSQRIEPRPCNRFSEDLIYFFYGRPAYRLPDGLKPGEPIELCPLCFVFKPATIHPKDIRRVFPCDTGAIRDGLFSPDFAWADHHELVLDPSIESARKFVQLCFQGNTSYYYGRLKPAISPAPGSTLDRYFTLVRRAPTTGADDRRSAIEVQVKSAVYLTGRLLFIALPREFFEEPPIRNAIQKQWKCEAIPYPTFYGDAPTEYHSVVRDRVTQWLEKEGLV